MSELPTDGAGDGRLLGGCRKFGEKKLVKSVRAIAATELKPSRDRKNSGFEKLSLSLSRPNISAVKNGTLCC
jgi:hypothetical protein